MMKFAYEFKGYGSVPSKCRVMIQYENGIHLVCFEDIGVGTSVTNASEQLATEIVEKMNFDPTYCRFFETYSQYDNDTFDEITYVWKYQNGTSIATKANWNPAPNEIKNLFINL